MNLGGFKARGDRAAAYCEALAAVEQAALDEAAARDRALLQELLTLFAARYARGEGARVGARLRGSPARGARPAPLAAGAARARAGALPLDPRGRVPGHEPPADRDRRPAADAETELFFVGDEFQSIYGFRHADVQVFRERREAAEQPLSLTLNYRSRPEVLAAVNELFGSHFGGEFQELAAAAEFPDPVFGHPVELLVTDKESYKDSGVHWRRGEARAVARRVRELVDGGAATPGEIVLLFAAGTDAEWYEDELRRAGLPTYRATGKGYFGQQQVVDLLMYLRLLQNRYDDTALLSVLASPFVGVSNDALALLRRVASRRPLFTGLEHALPPGLAERDERLMRAFRQRYDRLVEAMPRLSLERLCEQIVAEHDYDLAVLAQWDGRRRYANMRKLARLARSYEELRGPDVEGFVRFVAEQEAVGARELEAVAEEEGADAVRLLTIHAAKGLEFKVVIVADAGRDRVPPSPDEILALPDGRFGFRVADPGDGEAPRRVRLRGGEGGAAGGGAGRAPAPLLRRDDAREGAADRLRLRRSRARSARRRRRSRGCSTGSPPTRSSRRPARRRSSSRAATRGCSSASTATGRSPRTGGARDRGGRPARALRRARGGRAPARGSRAAAARGAARAAAPPRAPALVHVALAVRAVRVQVLRALRARDERAAGRGRGRRREVRRPRSAAPSTRCSRRSTSPHRSCPSSRTSWSAASWPRTASRTSRAASRRSRASRRSATSPSSTTASSCTASSTPSICADGRALVVDYKTNALGEASPEEIVEHDYRLQRLVYALACFRAGRRGGRGRLPLPRAPRTRRSRPSSRAPTCLSSRPSSPRRSPASRPESSRRRRATSPAPAARRSTSSARGRGCVAAAGGDRVAG